MDIWCRRAVCMFSPPAFLLVSSFHCTSNCPFSFLTTSRFGRFSLKNCSTGVCISSFLKYERSKRSLVRKCSDSTSPMALMAALWRSTVEAIKISFTQKEKKGEIRITWGMTLMKKGEMFRFGSFCYFPVWLNFSFMG